MSFFSSLSEGIAILGTSSSYVAPSKATSKEIRDLVSAWILAQKKAAQARHNIWSCILPGVDNTLRHRILSARKHPDFNETDFDESLKYVLPSNQIPVFFHVRGKAASIYQNMPARKSAEAPAPAATAKPAAKSNRKKAPSSDGKKQAKQGIAKVGTPDSEPAETSAQIKIVATEMYSDSDSDTDEPLRPVQKRNSAAKAVSPEKESDDNTNEPRRSVRKRNPGATIQISGKKQKISRVSLVLNNVQEKSLSTGPLMASSEELMNTKVGRSRNGRKRTETTQRGAVVEKRKARDNSSPPRNTTRLMSTPKRTIQESRSVKSSLAAGTSVTKKKYTKKETLQKKRAESRKQETAQEEPQEDLTKKPVSSQTPLAGKSKRATKLAAKITPPPANSSAKNSSARTKGSPSKQKTLKKEPRSAKVAASELASKPVASPKPQKEAGATKQIVGKAGKAASRSAKGVAKSATKGTTKGKGAAKESVKKPRKGATALPAGTMKLGAPTGQGKRKRSQMKVADDQVSPGRDPTVNSDSDTEVLTKALPSTTGAQNVLVEDTAAAQPGNGVSLWQRFIQSFTIASTSPIQGELPTSASSRASEDDAKSLKRRRLDEKVKEKLRASGISNYGTSFTSARVSPDRSTLVPISTVLQRIERNLGIANHTLTAPQVETPGVDFSKYQEMLERHARRLTETFEHLKLRSQREWNTMMIQTEAEQKTKWPALLQNQKNRWVDFKDDIRSLLGRCARDFHQQIVSGRNQLTVPERRFYTAARQSLKWRQERLEDAVGRMDREATDFCDLDRDLQLVQWVEFLGLLQRRFKVLEASEEALLTTHLEDCAGILHSE